MYICIHIYIYMFPEVGQGRRYVAVVRAELPLLDCSIYIYIYIYIYRERERDACIETCNIT